MSLVITAPPAPIARRAPRQGVGEGPVRLTLRGRLVIFAGPIILLLLVLSAGWLATSAAATDAAAVGTTTEVVVAPGETLWQVAETAAPTVDPRETVAVIIELNGLSSASVQAGQSLLVPVV